MDTIIIIYLIGVLINLLVLTIVFYKKYQEGEEIRVFTIIGGCIISCMSFLVLVPLAFIVIISEDDDDWINVVVFKKKEKKE